MWQSWGTLPTPWNGAIQETDTQLLSNCQMPEAPANTLSLPQWNENLDQATQVS